MGRRLRFQQGGKELFFHVGTYIGYNVIWVDLADNMSEKHIIFDVNGSTIFGCCACLWMTSEGMV